MTTEKTAKTYSIDAAGKTLGRVASEAAKALMGKTSADYTPHIRSDVKVSVTNLSKIYAREKKQMQSRHTRYSGYPGGFKVETKAQLKSRKGFAAVLRLAVARMLPRNTMHTARMKNLIISE